MRAVLLAVLLLTACGQPVKPAPQVVQVSIPTYVQIPPDLTAACHVSELQGRTWGNLADLVVNLRADLKECSDRMATIAKVQGSPAK